MNEEEFTCWECACRLGEECGFYGHEVYPDTPACDQFQEESD